MFDQNFVLNKNVAGILEIGHLMKAVSINSVQQSFTTFWWFNAASDLQ